MSTEWANPCWTYLRLNYVLLGVPMVAGLFAIAISFIRRNERVVESVAKSQPKSKRVVCKEQKPKEVSSSSDNGNAVLREDGTMLISCPSCKKVFSRPLVMLNFKGRKTRLVNVCPYCNHVSGNAENEQTPKGYFQIANEDRKLTY